MKPAVLLVLAALCACASPLRYGRYHDRVPAVVLVLPPLNETADLRASDDFLSTITRPLAEAGYYVVPVAVADRMMKENGLPTPGDMHNVALKKLREIFGADAVMYIKITHWGAAPGGAGVVLAYRLVDTRDGAVLWERVASGSEEYVRSSSHNALAVIATAVVGAAIGEAAGPSQQLVRDVNAQAFNTTDERLLRGRRHPAYAKEQQRVVLDLQAQAKAP